jgi:colanic acid biosynthesis glycosyl transferase WcaI
MRFLIYGINFSPELTGIGKYTGEMAQWLARRGHTVTAVTALPYYPQWKIQKGYPKFFYRRETIAGVRVIRCPLWVPMKLTALQRILHLVSFSLTSFWLVFWKALRERPDVMITIEPSFLCAPVLWLAAKLSRSKTWLHVQDFELDAAFELHLLRGSLFRRVVMAVERFFMGRFDKVSSISERMVQQLSQKEVKPERQFLFPNWVDTEAIYPHERCNGLRRSLGLSGEHTVVLYAGNMGRKQGLEIIIEAAHALKDRSDIRFVMCGDGSVRPELEKLAERRDNIYWLPLQPLERLNELLSMADIHLLTQRSQLGICWMPSKLTAMMANGRPVVATADPDSPVAHVVKECGEVVSPGNRDQFVQAIVNLTADIPRRQALGEAARRYAVSHWHKENVLTAFEKALVELAQSRRSS